MVYGGAGGTSLPGKAPSSLGDGGRRGTHVQAMLFISPGFTPQTGLSSTTETQGGSDWGRRATASCSSVGLGGHDPRPQVSPGAALGHPSALGRAVVTKR